MLLKNKIKPTPIIQIISSNEIDTQSIRRLDRFYKVIHTNPSKIIINLIIELHPSLIIIDGDDYGKTLFSELKSMNTTKLIPTLFSITNESTLTPRTAYEMGALDIVNLNNIDSIFMLKIKNYLQLFYAIENLKHQANIAREANPNTGLPGNNAIISNIYYSLEYELDNVVVYVDLDHFKAYNDTYGFGRGDIILKFVATLLEDVLKPINDYTFLGHIGGDDFVFIAPKRLIREIAAEIIDSFDSHIVRYYNDHDIENKYITTESRTGKVEQFPIMTISLGGVPLIYHNTETRFEEISDLCTEVKKHAKSYPYSYFYMDRRKGSRKMI